MVGHPHLATLNFFANLSPIGQDCLGHLVESAVISE